MKESGLKKLCYSAFIAFWSTIATLLALQTLADNQVTTAASKALYTLAEVMKHATEDDCWMAIEGKVYNLTAYLAKHPAGPGTMLSWCGSEATEGMRTKGIGSDHSNFAWRQLETYFIGTLQ